MSSLGISYRVDDAEALRYMEEIEARAARPGAALNAMGAEMVFSTQRNFERQQAPDGTPWAPLSPRTANKRIGGRRRGTGHILRQSTRLYRSIAYEVEGMSFEWGSNVVYARIHQLGGTIDMPARRQTVSLKSIRKKGGGIRTRFAKRGTRGATDRDVSIGAHTVTIPARPYLGVSDADQQRLAEIATQHLTGEAS